MREDKEKEKILVLVMSCNLPQYKQREEDIRNTWGKDILEKKHENIDLWFFTSGEHDMIDMYNHKLYTKCNDLRDRTFQKLMKTIYNAEANGLEYDWILRVNISTYINIELIDMIVQHSPSDEFLYAGTLFSQPWILNRLPFLSGEYLLLSKKNIEYLKKFYTVNKEYFDKLEADPRTDTKWVCDDGWITTCFDKVYKADKDVWEYGKRIHSLGLLMYNDDRLTIPDTRDYKQKSGICMMSSIPGISFKTMVDGDPDLDKDPIHESSDRDKLYKIHETVTENKVRDLTLWYKWYVLNVYDQWCYPYKHVVDTRDKKRSMSERITKRQMMKEYRDYKRSKK